MSAPLTLKARGVAASIVARVPSGGPRPLAPAPAGSGLRPVMGTPGLPVVGSTLGFLQNSLAYMRRFHADFGTVFWTNAFGTRLVLVVGPDGIETVLANRDRAFANKEGWEHFIGAFFERGVMLMDFEEHRHHRRIMQQAFKRERLVTYLDKMNPAIERGLAAWQPGADFELYPAMKQLTLDIATEVFVGADLGAQADRLNEAFIDVVVGGQAIVRADMPGGRWHRGLESRRLLEDYFRTQIPAKRAGDGEDLFSVLCHAESEDGERFSDDDVVNHMIFTLMAAHDTSTITLAMMAYYLAANPVWQERLREECRALGKTTIGYDDVDALPLMDLVFKETLRMNAPVGMVAREAIKDTAIDGCFIPKGTRIMLGIYPMQRMEPWWNDPDTFDPERFTEDRREDASHKFAWTPFGGNVHKCIGMHFGSMEVKAILHQLLLGYSWTVDPGYEPLIDYGTGPFPGDGLPITLRAL
ncbi:Putative cytochrome P450 136 [Paraconexibacter sp. AEG42_29]|uniref:Cytochrome P450 136 n=1 Tax=Paraconexibacter sp. AEG42_29 TaxID=2997339 RepID=A0AAU7AU86_9ACTN